MHAIGYVRVSTEEQVDSGLSLAAQRRDIEARAILSRLDLIAVLEDPGESARDLKRPAMIELLARIDGGLVDAVVIARLDRLTRSVRDLSMLVERLKRAKRADGGRGVDLISATESLDTSSAVGRLLVNILASVSQWEREAIAERTSRALQQLKAQGKSAGTPQFGYAADEAGFLIADDNEQAVLQIIAELRQEGLSWERVAASLTGQGWRNRNGAAYSRQGLFAIGRKHDIK